ncbi:MAG: hypothetical protein NWF09_02185 [Candidatus Bathyarchaeota archaeon]|nr:hypothetical protein [Candidatus Bathyarchaeota archaeon]
MLKELERMKGAIVFLAVFAIAVIITLGDTSIPPGKAIYDALLPGTEAAAGYLVGGQVDAVTLIIAVFNGVIYGFIAWLIFTIINSVFKKDKKQNIQQVVNVNISDKNKDATVK